MLATNGPFFDPLGMRLLFRLTGFSRSAVSSAFAGWVALAVAADPAPTNRWDGEVAAFGKADIANPPPPAPILFTGGSSVRLWTNLASSFPGRPLLNRGIGGCHMSDVNHHFDRLVGQYAPSVVLVYAGDNDIAAGKSPETVAAEFATFRKKIRTRFPSAQGAYLAIKPSPSRIKFQEAQQEANRRIAALIRTDPHWKYLDTFTVVLGADGKPDPACYLPDNLHLNAEGYRRWVGVIGPWLDAVGPLWPTPIIPGRVEPRP